MAQTLWNRHALQLPTFLLHPTGIGRGLQPREAPAGPEDERTPEAPTAGSLLGRPDPGSRCRDRSPAGQAPPTGRPPPPAVDSDGLGPGLPVMTSEHGPPRPSRRRPARDPTSCIVGPQGPPSPVGVRACGQMFMVSFGEPVRGLGREVAAPVLSKMGSGPLNSPLWFLVTSPIPKASVQANRSPGLEALLPLCLRNPP